MPANSTRATDASVEAYLDARASPQQRADSAALIVLLGGITGEAPTMWGPSIVGFGRYRYTYDSGRSGEAPLVGFAIRGRELVLYLDGGAAAQQDLLARLGRHRMGKACLYVRQLSDLDPGVLAQLIRNSVAAIRARYG